MYTIIRKIPIHGFAIELPSVKQIQYMDWHTLDWYWQKIRITVTLKAT